MTPLFAHCLRTASAGRVWLRALILNAIAANRARMTVVSMIARITLTATTTKSVMTTTMCAFRKIKRKMNKNSPQALEGISTEEKS